MGFDFKSFNVEDEKYAQDSLVPEGKYTAIITEAIETPTNNGLGRYLKCKYQIVDGQFSGRVVFDNLHLQNKNQKAVEIAESKLANIFKSINVLHPQSEQDMLNKPMLITVKIKKSEGYEDQNIVGSYIKSVKGGAAKASSPAPKTKVKAPSTSNDIFESVEEDDIDF